MNNKLKILMCWPSAEFSIYDVADGLKQGFQEIGQEVVDYLLYNRMRIYSAGMYAVMPKDQEMIVDLETTALHASEAIVYKAVVNNCNWAFIVSGMGLHPNAIAVLRKLGIKIACWFTEGPYDSDDSHELHLAQLCDVVFTNDRSSVKTFQYTLDKTTHGEVYFIPHAVNPKIHKPDIDHGLRHRDIDVFFLGTGFTDRQALFEAMDFSNFNFVLGGLWTGVKEPSELFNHLKIGCIRNKELIDYYYRTKVLLNPHRYSETALSMNPRVREAVATKTFCISDFRQEIPEVFGDSVITYQPGNAWELQSKINYYLKHEDIRDNLVEAAYNRLLSSEYTFADRATFIISKLENYKQNKLKLVS